MGKFTIFRLCLQTSVLALGLAASLRPEHATSLIPLAQAQAGTPPAMTDPFRPYAASVSEAAARFGISESSIRAVMRVESAGNPRAVSHAGAMGLMQLMPATWATLRLRHGLGDDPFDIRANIMGGAAYLRAMLDRYGDLATALAAYNAGPARVDGWRSGTRSLPAETIAYVARLAPALQGSATGPAGPRLPLAISWRSAAIFARHDAVASVNTIAVTQGPPPPLIDLVPPLSGHVPVSPPIATLFIPLSGRNGR